MLLRLMITQHDLELKGMVESPVELNHSMFYIDMIPSFGCMTSSFVKAPFWGFTP